MICLGCYKTSATDYCLPCRKKLFGGARVPAVLPFSSPGDGNMAQYRDETKRMSISGVQLKYSLKLQDGKLMLTEGNGEYILKPIPPSVKIANADQAPENERLTMQLAEQIFKIETAANALIYFDDGQPAYITKRFDRKQDGNKSLQEDFAQLSGKSKQTHGPDFKYNGTYEAIGLLIKKYVAAYAPAMEIFFRTIFFNYLISNGDAHLKNFSLIQAEQGDYRLTPAYDLMSTLLHVPNESDTALDLFDGDTDTEYYQAYGHHGYPDFMELAKRIGIMEKRAKRIIEDMTARTDKVNRLIDRSLLAADAKIKYRDNYLDKVKRIVIV